MFAGFNESNTSLNLEERYTSSNFDDPNVEGRRETHTLNLTTASNWKRTGDMTISTQLIENSESNHYVGFESSGRADTTAPYTSDFNSVDTRVVEVRESDVGGMSWSTTTTEKQDHARSNDTSELDTKDGKLWGKSTSGGRVLDSLHVFIDGYDAHDDVTYSLIHNETTEMVHDRTYTLDKDGNETSNSTNKILGKTLKHEQKWAGDGQDGQLIYNVRRLNNYTETQYFEQDELQPTKTTKEYRREYEQLGTPKVIEEGKEETPNRQVRP